MRMVWNATSENNTRLCEHGEGKSCNGTIYRKYSAAFVAFLPKRVSYWLLDILYKEFLTKINH